MKKKLLRSIICFLLAVIMITESNLGSFVSFASEVEDGEVLEEETGEEEEFIPMASSYLYPFEEAVSSLEELAVGRDIQGVVYLADEIMLKALPEEGSEPMKQLFSGDVVSIVSAGQDAEYNIWYQVIYKSETEEVTGYIPRDYVACVDEEFLLWQDNYVRSISLWGLRGSRYSTADIESFPESYQEDLLKIKEAHPNWIFVKMNTNISWNTLIKSQFNDRSLIENYVKESWKNGRYGAGWSYASEGIIKYFIDPRNWLNQTDIFQFELLGYYSEYHTVEAVESLLKGTFMASARIENGKTYAETFVELGRITGVSPFMIASRVRQEQGASGDSALISGNYKGYEGYYNFFNIQAAGDTTEEIIKTGLEYAKEKGWDSKYKALKGGAEFLVKGYINAGQDTLYLQKFDVDSRSNGVFWHQYMQNIRAPYFEARSVYSTYNKNGLLDQPFVFRIPVYNNMSSRAAVAPGDEDIITLSSTKIDNLQVDSEVTLRPYINGKDVEGINWEFTSSDTSVATVDNYGVVKAIKAGEVTITCENAEEKEYTKSATCSVKIVPKDIDISQLEIPELEAITYNPNGKLQDIKLPEGYTWVNPDMVPLVAQSTYSVIYNPNQEKITPITFDISLTVNKRVISSSEYTIPKDLEGGATRELSSVMLPNGFMWNDPTEKLADTIGTKTYLASYNLDVDNYETVTDIEIPVKIVCEKHSFTEWDITEATCEEDGVKNRTCTICDSKEELVIDKTGHLYEAEVTKEATEEEEGIRTYSCKNCDSTYTEVIPKLPSTHVHKYEEETVKKASCTEAGMKKFTCSCEDSYTEVIEASGHKMDNGRCQNCGYTEAVETPKQDETDKTPSDNTENEDEGVKNPPESEDKKEEGEKTPSESTDKKDEGVKNPTESEDRKEEGEKTPSESTDKKDEGVKQPAASEEKTEENSTTPSDSTNKVDEGVKQPAASEEKTEENSTTPSESTNKTEEGVKQTTTSEDKKVEADENKAELELMSSLVEMADENTEEGEKRTVSIQLNKNTEISQKIVEMAKEHGVNLEVSLPNALKWTIKADSLGDGMPSSINLNAQIVNEVIEKEVINTVVTEEEYMELSLSHDGMFGFEATLTIPVEEKYIGQTANLFYFNEKTRELEFVMAAPVDEEGNILLDFNHASDYVIVFAEKSMEDVAEITETLIEENDEFVDTSMDRSQEKKEELNKLLVICIIILVVSGMIALVGYLLYKREDKTEEIKEAPTFEEWLKEDVQVKNAQVSKPETKEEKQEYLDDEEEDDYREKEVAPTKTFHTGEIHLEEDYLDDDVDDYQEKDLK